MNGARAFVAFALACALLPAFPRGVAADAPAPLDYKAYDGWNAIRTPKISDDGTHVAYALTPEDGDPTLVVRDLDSGAERRENRGSAPAFAANGRFVVYTHVAAKKDVDAAKKAKKPESQQPKNGAGILDLASAKPAEVVDNVKTIYVAKNGGATVAYRAEPSPAPSASPVPAASSSPVAAARPSAPPKGEPPPQVTTGRPPSPAASASPAPSPSASPAPKADKTKETGSPLTIRDLANGKRVVAADSTEAAISDDDRFVAYATESKDGKNDGLRVYDASTGTTATVLSGAGRYHDIALARDGSSLAFLSDVATYASDVPHDALYVVDLRAAKPAAAKAVDAGTPGLESGTTPNANGTLRFSRDGRRVFLGTAPEPTPMPSGTPAPTAVDLWTWHDDVLQSQQKHDADRERKRTYLAAYDVATKRYAQLGSPTLRDVTTPASGDVALGEDDRAYRRASSWLGRDYADVYAVSIDDGHRRLLGRRESTVSLSPDGRYALGWDERARHWFATRTSDGRRVELGARAGVAFHDVDDDHPAPPPAYGIGGWIEGDRGVLLYDAYDVWLANPDTGDATNLTRGEGRRTRTVYSPVSTDPDATAFKAGAPILLGVLDTRDFSSGFARVPVDGGVPSMLFKAPEVVNGTRFGSNEFVPGLYHDLTYPPIVAKHADRWLFQRESFRTYRDLWLTNASFAHPVRESDANPQQAKYRWGTERLVAYTSADGRPMRGVMLIPDGVRADRKAPMLVYFYETWSSMFHTYYAPGPGTSPNFPRYVSNGYVVFFPDVHYRPGHPGESALQCVLPGVDAALRTGYADPARVGIAGHSWAAYQINYMITKTHRFRAAEAGAAVDDMISAYSGIRLESGVVRESQYEHTQSRIGATPWDRPDLYLENSGLFGVKNVTTPYLTIHNELDGAVPQYQGIEYITAMRRLGKEAYLFSFDGEDHNLRGREQQKYWTVHLDEWFDYWLKGAPRPEWMNGVDFLHRGRRDVHPLYGEPD
ncbi:MAG TPA: prolyl oligopeptidase family serine peptidase [Candidatus Elarobacter sp.]|nr:prolyl oligopeptidase family serine peptidase [Candidatus Elarobacter sp.]